MQPNVAGAESTTQVGNGTWRHICGTNDGTTSRLYIDGVLDASATESVSSLQPTVTFGHWQGGTRYLNGLIDDVRIYNRALSPDEIKRLYNMGR